MVKYITAAEKFVLREESCIRRLSCSYIPLVDSWNFASLSQLLKVSRSVGHAKLEMADGNLRVLSIYFALFIDSISNIYLFILFLFKTFLETSEFLTPNVFHPFNKYLLSAGKISVMETDKSLIPMGRMFTLS